MSASLSLRKEAKAILLRHAGKDRLSTSAVRGLRLMHFAWTSLPLVAMQSPCMALVLQGGKSLSFGLQHLEYAEGQYLLTPIDMPVTSQIIRASHKQPMLAIALEINAQELRQVIRRCNSLPQTNTHAAINVYEAQPELLEPIVRLLRLLDTPQDKAALAPLIRQEILYRLLSGPSGARLMEMARHNSPSNRITRALTWLQTHFAKRLLVEELARRVGMSPSSFHQHFKAVTTMSPIQYLRRIRLYEARRFLLVDSLSVGDASFRVGYQSHSQFTKDYRQHFGVLPKDDVIAHRSSNTPFAAYSPE